jgi:signal transduction histidine kinase
MTDAIAPVATAIASAQEQLQTALAALATLPVVEADTLEVTRHALHNYLALTGMTLEVVLQDLGTAADPSILGWLRGLQHVTDLMTHTVRRLGATPALEPAHLACERVDLVAGVRRVCHFFDRQAQRKQLSIHLEARGDIPAVWTDRVAAAVVLTNLLSNAIKYSPPGKAIHVTLEGDATGVTCAIQDEGPGLDVAEQAQLFQRGVRLSLQPTAGEASHGYGLAVAKELLDLVGGSLWCRSAPGQGACFAFRLPAASAGAAAPAGA